MRVWTSLWLMIWKRGDGVKSAIVDSILDRGLEGEEVGKTILFCLHFQPRWYPPVPSWIKVWVVASNPHFLQSKSWLLFKQGHKNPAISTWLLCSYGRKESRCQIKDEKIRKYIEKGGKQHEHLSAVPHPGAFPSSQAEKVIWKVPSVSTVRDKQLLLLTSPWKITLGDLLRAKTSLCKHHHNLSPGIAMHSSFHSMFKMSSKLITD